MDSTITGCISISDFASLLCIPIRMKSSPRGLNICAIAVEIKKYNSIIKKKKNKHGRTVLLAKSKLNCIEASFSKTLIDWNISHDGLVLINNLL